MNYTSSQSYHTLNHWQSNKKSTKQYTIVYPNIFALTLDGSSIIPFISKSLGDFTWGDDVELVGRGVKLVPAEPTEINYCEKITFDDINYYIVLADKHSVGGLESDRTGGRRINLTVSGSKNGDPEDSSSVSDCTFGSQVIRGVFDEYALFVIVGDQLPSWFGSINYEETAPNSDDADYFYKPFQNYYTTINDKYPLQFTPIANDTTGSNITFQANVSKYFTDQVGVRANTYTSIQNYISLDLTGDFMNSVIHQPITDLYYYNNNYYTVFGEAACDAMNINTKIFSRLFWLLAPISDNIYSTWVYKLTNITYS